MVTRVPVYDSTTRRREGKCVQLRFFAIDAKLFLSAIGSLRGLFLPIRKRTCSCSDHLRPLVPNIGRSRSSRSVNFCGGFCPLQFWLSSKKEGCVCGRTIANMDVHVRDMFMQKTPAREAGYEKLLRSNFSRNSLIFSPLREAEFTPFLHSEATFGLKSCTVICPVIIVF